MKCSVCSSEINENYCPRCGQLYKNRRVSMMSFSADLFGNIFSLEKSFLKNMKIGIKDPGKLINNYWNGFRGYYYSPSKFLTIASLFFLIPILLSYDFLGAVVTSRVAQQFSILAVLIVFFSLSSFMVYITYRKRFSEHLIMNIYNVSLWSIIFVPISILLNILNVSKSLKFDFFMLYLLLIITWNSMPFNMDRFMRVLFVVLNCILLILIVLSANRFTEIVHF